jgi:hypothetical protein
MRRIRRRGKVKKYKQIQIYSDTFIYPHYIKNFTNPGGGLLCLGEKLGEYFDVS